MPKFIDLAGQVFGRLTAVEVSGRDSHGLILWRCRCECGGESFVRTTPLRSGRIRSCGCLQAEHTARLGRSKMTHGLSKSKEESAYRHMIRRCYSERDSQYQNYGARGITVCDRWLASFQNFIDDMGVAPSQSHSLDRINVDRGYSPENCRWATWTEQQRNRRNNRVVCLNGVSASLAEWCDRLGAPYSRVYARVHVLGWSVERALFTP